MALVQRVEGAGEVDAVAPGRIYDDLAAAVLHTARAACQQLLQRALYALLRLLRQAAQAVSHA